MPDVQSEGIVFFTCVSAEHQTGRARLLMEGIRRFGGPMADCPFWVVEADPRTAPCTELAEQGARILPLTVPDSVGGYLFAAKVSACRAAEREAASEAHSLIWVIPESLILRPPVLFDLNASISAAVRPVHIRNVGSPAAEPADEFWRGVYRIAGGSSGNRSVESFVDAHTIRPYFNSAALSVDPGAGIFARWMECFEAAVTDRAFQESACSDERHRIFLHQALLSALLSSLAAPLVRVLPPDYGYPYNLHDSVPSDRAVAMLDELVCVIYEHRSLDPATATDIGMSEDLRSWLSARWDAPPAARVGRVS